MTYSVMSRDSRKIVRPTEEETARYAGPGKSEAEAPRSPGVSEAGIAERSGGVAASAAGAEVPAGAESPTEVTPPSSEAEEWKDKFLRAKAELANYQRRVERERNEALRYAHAQLMQALLPILDDLERLVGSACGEATIDVDAVVGGAKLTLDSFLKLLSDFRVERIEALGQRFDPAVHQAVMEQPSEEHAEPTVLAELAKGYRLHDRVLRPARVVVSRPAAGPAAEQSGVDERTPNDAGAGE